MVELTGLRTTQNESVIRNPIINTDLLNVENQPSDCMRIQSIFKSHPTPDSFLQQFKIKNTITNLQTFRDQLISSRADTLRNLPSGQNTEFVRTYLNKLNNSVLPYYELMNTCVKEGIESDLDKWNEQKELTSESKERYEAIAHPELQVSYYEGWFPLVRPMKETSLFILFSIGAFLILFSLVFFLRMSGVEFNIQIPFSGDSFSSYNKYIGYSIFLGILVASIGYATKWFKK